MLVIKKKQMEAFTEIELEKFKQLNVEFVRINCPEWYERQARDDVEENISFYMDEIMKCGIIKKSNIQRAVSYTHLTLPTKA